MTATRDAREIAEKMINNSHLNRAHWSLTGVDASILAKEHLALLERLAWFENTADKLWQILDDISTLGDIHKPENNLYFRGVNQLCEHRSNYANSPDGQKLVWEIDSEAKT